jgi:hypothetical protein
MNVRPEHTKMLMRLAANEPELREYLNELSTWICDVRNGDLPVEARKQMAELFDTYLIHKLRTQAEPKTKEHEYS